ncbi:MAG: hypothetical protein HQ500_13320 [Flavobacteriales bacterium]|nr:hypothetical protein [Flavobacteriales bacterium]
MYRHIGVALFALIAVSFISPQGLVAQDFSGGLEQEETEAPQEEEEYSLKEHIRLGGNVGAQFGSITFINVSPMLGYQFNKRFLLGMRGTYQYYKIQGYNQLSSNVFGASGFGRFFAFENIYTHAEYEVLNGYFDRSGERINLPFLYFGIGYLQSISNNVGISATALYEVLRFNTSPSILPMIRVGIVVSL